jgi:hypothetical protein
VRKNLILDHRRVVEEVALLDREAVHLGHHDPPERIDDAGVYVHQVELGVVLVVAEKVDSQVFAELFEAPGVVFAGPVPREVVAGDVADAFGVDADNL